MLMYAMILIISSAVWRNLTHQKYRNRVLPYEERGNPHGSSYLIYAFISFVILKNISYLKISSSIYIFPERKNFSNKFMKQGMEKKVRRKNSTKLINLCNVSGQSHTKKKKTRVVQLIIIHFFFTRQWYVVGIHTSQPLDSHCRSTTADVHFTCSLLPRVPHTRHWFSFLVSPLLCTYESVFNIFQLLLLFQFHMLINEIVSQDFTSFL